MYIDITDSINLIMVRFIVLTRRIEEGPLLSNATDETFDTDQVTGVSLFTKNK